MTSENHFNLTTKFKTWHLWAFLLIAKLILSYFLPLSFDEAYYWVWSHHLQLSYFDHPPMVAWILSVGHFLESVGYLVRFPIIVTGHITAWLWVLILREITEKKNFIAEASLLIIISSNLFLGVGALVATPDVPLNFFWSLSLLFTLKLLSTKKSVFAWLLGASLGLGFLSKYHIVLFPIGILLGLVLNRKLYLIRPSWVLRIFLSGLLFSLPVLIWNYQNDWASFHFQLDHGLNSQEFDIRWPVEYIIGQIFFIGPVTLFLFLRGFNSKTDQMMLLSFSGAFGLLFFFLTSFKAPVEPNWPIMTYLPIVLIAFLSQQKKFLKVQTLVYFSILSIAIFLLFHPQYQLQLGKISEPFEYKPLVSELKNYEPLYTSRYQMASVLWFELKRPVYKVPEISRYDFFETLHSKDSFPKKFYVLVHDNKELPKWLQDQGPTVRTLKKYHDRLKLIEVHLP